MAISVKNEPESARVKISPYARKLAVKADIDIRKIGGTGPNGRIIGRDIESAIANKPVASRSCEAQSSLFTSANIAELKAAESSLSGALSFKELLMKSAHKAAPTISVRFLGEGIEGGAPVLSGDESAAFVFAAPTEGRIRIYLLWRLSEMDSDRAALVLGKLQCIVENPYLLLV